MQLAQEYQPFTERDVLRPLRSRLEHFKAVDCISQGILIVCDMGLGSDHITDLGVADSWMTASKPSVCPVAGERMTSVPPVCSMIDLTMDSPSPSRWLTLARAETVGRFGRISGARSDPHW